MGSLACDPGGERPVPGGVEGAPTSDAAREHDEVRAPDAALFSDEHLIPGPRPIATGGRAVDQLAWADWRLVGADCQGMSSVLLAWDDPEQDPRELARIPGRVRAMAPAPDGQRVAIEAAYPEDPERWSSNDPASLLVLELRSGRVRTLVGSTRGANLRGATWAPDSRTLAVPGWSGDDDSLEADAPSRRMAVVRVLDAGTGDTIAQTAPRLELEPLRWDGDGLVLRRHDPLGSGAAPSYTWSPGKGEPVLLDSPRWPSPDGRYALELRQGELQVRRGTGQANPVLAPTAAAAEALAAWPGSDPPAWCGTHHLALLVAGEILCSNLANQRWQPLAPVGSGLPRSDRSGHRLILQAGAEPWWGWAP
jgi:hypothetical protein